MPAEHVHQPNMKPWRTQLGGKGEEHGEAQRSSTYRCGGRLEEEAWAGEEQGRRGNLSGKRSLGRRGAGRERSRETEQRRQWWRLDEFFLLSWLWWWLNWEDQGGGTKRGVALATLMGWANEAQISRRIGYVCSISVGDVTGATNFWVVRLVVWSF
jgi:hypothetical protein